MEENIKQIITEAKSICLIPFENEPESLTAALALFYTLKELDKNVNFIAENFPENLNFLIPSLDFISSPKNFVVSIPRSVADISQIYYEKTDESLKIHLTTDKGNIKKENISFYFQDVKPDLIVTLGIQDFRQYLENKLDSFGFLLNSPILNIDNNSENLKFGQVNIIDNKSLSEIILNLIKSIDHNLVKKNAANCLLAGLIIYYENFKSENTSAEAFNIASELIEMGGNNQQIVDNLHKTTEGEINFLGDIFQNLKKENNVYVAALDSTAFENFPEAKIGLVIEKIKTIGIQNNLLVLWKSHASEIMIKGFFYSKKTDLINKISENYQGLSKKDWVFLSLREENINSAKEKIMKLLH